jgi:hypothetical protein
MRDLLQEVISVTIDLRKLIHSGRLSAAEAAAVRKAIEHLEEARRLLKARDGAAGGP